MSSRSLLASRPFIALCALLCSAISSTPASADVSIATGYSREDAGFDLPPVPPPAVDDAAASATFKVIGGTLDPNSRGGLAALHDGRLPSGDDAPADNFFFARTSQPGRLLIDLGKSIRVKSVATYSWHSGGRAAQNYTLYSAEGMAVGFKLEPEAGTDPVAVGWTLMGKVDTSEKGPGQHGVEFSGGPAGKTRYLLMEVRPNADRRGFGETFFSEIDVIDADAPDAKRIRTEKVIDTYTTADGKYTFTVDATRSPDLRQWFGEKAIPAVKEWYPKIADMLAVPGQPAPVSMTLRLQEGQIMPGNSSVPAFAEGGNIVVSSDFLRSQKKGEAIGCVIHEIVHVAQSGVRGDKRRSVPGWVTEGVADYIRWFLFEPESRGAEIRNPFTARHDASYRVTANFFDWVIRTKVKDLPQKLNATYSTGYEDGLWKEWTGLTVEELEAEWKLALRK